MTKRKTPSGEGHEATEAADRAGAGRGAATLFAWLARYREKLAAVKALRGSRVKRRGD